MSSFTAILDPQADGTLHLPLPSDWLKYRVRVSAQLEPIKPTPIEYEHELKGFGCLRGKITMLPGFDDPIEDFKEYIS
jgi:hypothetical protein